MKVERVAVVGEGAYERGYATGYEVGNNEGYTKGRAEGVEQGYIDGVQSAQAEINSLVEKTVVKYRNDSATSIGNYVFAEISGLQEVDLPMVKTVGGFAFQSSTRLHTVNLPRVETIGNRAFVNTFALSYLDLPACTSIGAACFHGSRIKTLILRSETVCIIQSGIFQTVPTVYVRDNLVEQYKSATNWSDYAEQIKPLSELEGEA